MKKMTLKEFKQALNDANIDFDIFGYEGILNMLSLHKTREAQRIEVEFPLHKGRIEDCYKSGETLYQILSDRGYYKD